MTIHAIRGLSRFSDLWPGPQLSEDDNKTRELKPWKQNAVSRKRQDSNLRGETPIDFKSIALTTRPRLPVILSPKFCHLIQRERYRNQFR